MSSPLLEIEGLSGSFRSPNGALTPVLHDVSFAVPRGTVTAIVGETGSGKSLTALSILGIQPPTFQRSAGRILFDGRDLLTLKPEEMRGIRGRRISIVFQDARAALNPVFTVGRQLADVHRLHHGGSASRAMKRTIEALRAVSIPEPERRARQYPHEFSGGMAQRAMIALAALVCEPELLILDEPTTGLDVTIQAAIMELIGDLVRERGLTACLITHDLGVVAETCDRVVVMNAGRVVETGTTEAIFTRPRQDYTRRLLAASQLGETPEMIEA
ncbi:ABC transporter ATP-binding protein [Roseomonas terrae]|jgi:ABC-type glutathione transport system ATPase component|uniref:ABC transporter ATP-binding protein n=1 Tax=Neoroseomonas terrae TaxID=424799 RepID=A0ABS5EGN6_9PROT|nr:ABC transporter ATP-binding protein [Neoroseomonas terrae]MBR0650188.1 ABC transporter ATP-binding protein [Neoroseomonas terrae]